MTCRTWWFLSFSVKIALGILLLLQYSSITVLLPRLYILTTSFWKCTLNTSCILVFSRHISLSPHWYVRLFVCFPSSWNMFACAFQKRYVKTYRCSVVRVYYFSIKSSTAVLSFLQICHVRCNTVCCVLLWFKSPIITDIINIGFIILCARHLQSPVARIILLCLFCFTNCFILR